MLRCRDPCAEVVERERRELGKRFKPKHFREKDVELVRTAEYRRNTLVWFVNSLDSVHRVTPREPTPFRCAEGVVPPGSPPPSGEGRAW